DWQTALTRDLPAAVKDAATTGKDLRAAQAAQRRVKAGIEVQRQNDIKAVTAKINADNGLLIQEQALSRLTRDDRQLMLTRIFILAALMVVDLLPLLLKTLSPTSQYARNVLRSQAEAQAELDEGATVAGYERNRRIQAARDGIDGRYDTDTQLNEHGGALWVQWRQRQTEAQYADDEELGAIERELWVQQEKEAIRRRYGAASPAEGGSAGGSGDDRETVVAGPEAAAPSAEDRPGGS